MPKQTFIGAFEGVSDNATTFDLEGDKLPRSMVRCFQRIVTGNQNGKSQKAKIGLKNGTTIVWLYGAAVTYNDQPVCFGGTVWATGDWVPFVRMAGAGVGDHIYLYTYGYVADVVS